MMHTEQPGSSTPRLSVIIPVFNGGLDLSRCLERLRESTYADYECIVVDDASTDNSTQVAAQHGATLLRLDRRGGPARARNHGVQRAQGEILVFLDADVCAHRDTLSRIAGHLEDAPSAQAVMGSYDDTPADPHLVSQYKNLVHHFVHQHSRRQASTFWAGCGAVRRTAFVEIGGFDESFARPCIEDIELGARMHARGWRLDLDPSIQVTHLKRWTLRSLIRTDVRDRAIPWLLLMLRQGSMPADLNVTFRHRLSVAVTALVAALMFLAIFLPSLRQAAFAAMAFSLVAVLLLNLDLFTFFARKRGAWFALCALPLHWLYYLYCGVSIPLALSIYAAQRGRRSPSSAPARM